MLVAGETSGDILGAELVQALRLALNEAPPTLTSDYQPLHTGFEPSFFGAGGPHMAAAGVELAVDMTAHAVIGLSDVVRNYFKFRRLFAHLFRLACDRQPDAIICVDFSGFNRRFAHALRQYARRRAGWFHDWEPKIIQYVSPQVWASREGRAYPMARDYDLLLSIIPFEKQWYAERVPRLPVEFVGHPIVERCAASQSQRGERLSQRSASPRLLLLPGSRPGELERHLPVMLAALAKMLAQLPGLSASMVLPNDRLAAQARSMGLPTEIELREGSLQQALLDADVAIASTGTVTLECALFGVPTVAMYITSWSTYKIGRRIVKVRYLAMPNLLANEEVFPEFIQSAATPENIANAALELLRDQARRASVRARLGEVAASLGPPGASRRAAQAILRLLGVQLVPGHGNLMLQKA